MGCIPNSTLSYECFTISGGLMISLSCEAKEIYYNTVTRRMLVRDGHYLFVFIDIPRDFRVIKKDTKYEEFSSVRDAMYFCNNLEES